MTWPALVPPTLRAIRWSPVLGAMAAGLAIVGVPAAMSVTLTPDNLAVLLRLATACAAVGLAFLYDDPAKPTTATAPAPAWHGVAIRTAAGITVLAAWWAAALAITIAGAQDGTGDLVPLRAVTLEAAAIGALAPASAVLAWRLAPRGVASTTAAPAVLVALAALAFAPRSAAFFVSVDGPDWTGAHQRLAAVLAAACLTTIVAASPVLPRRPAATRTAAAASGQPAAATAPTRRGRGRR
ncbi:hypothetical protein [Dactylosporangium sp. NPDC000521]|uniref:hypothetical protein n=1 Tax=Dactylosporangium sp. NPDC000521 TaxID=3363975 RepID=UPI0036C28E8C